MYEENNLIELKRELIDEVKNEIVAFLNTNGGIIYIGVNDDGNINNEFIKLDKDEILLKVSSWVQEAFYPCPSSLIDFRFNNDNVLEIKIKEGSKKPYYLKDKGPKPAGVYKRVGTSTRICSDDEILKMIMDSNNYDYESEISDNQDLTFKYFSKVCEEKNIIINNNLMISLGLENIDMEYTNLGLLISDQSPLEVKIAEYDNNMNFKMKKTLQGSLLKLIIESQEQANRLNDVSATINEKTWQREEILSFPGDSLREIILNAFCHCDYFIRSNIKIEFYGSKAKITSPGGLFKTTLEDMLKGVQTYRNKRLVHLLDKLGYIENFGTGIPRTLNAYLNTGKEPSFYNSENFFIVYLPNLNYKEQFNQISEQINDQIKISDIGLDILKIINKYPGIKVAKIQELLLIKYQNINLDKIRNTIKREIKDYIMLDGSKKTGGYRIKIYK